MIKKNTIFDFATHIMVIWGIEMLSLCIFCPLFGEHAKDVSSMFALGSAGIPVATLLQYLTLATVITALRWLFFSDKLIKRLSVTLRSAFMLAGTFISTGMSAAIFHWFPVNQAMPWIMFFVCFSICTVVSIFLCVLKEKTENRKLQDALDRLKKETA